MSTMPGVTGASGEILVVIDKAKWQSKLGDTIRWFLSEPIPVDPLSIEPSFNITQVHSDKFSGTFNRHRNIIVVTINPKKKQGYSFSENAWSSPQLLCNFNAVSVDSAIQMIIRNGKTIREKFINKEVDRWVKLMERDNNANLTTSLTAKHNYWVLTPRGYKLDVNKDHFFWISSENRDIILGVISWDYPFTSKEQLTVENLMKKRNEIVKENVPGPLDKSYMVTEMNFPPRSKEIIYKGRYFMQIEGFWKLEGAFMGGPFISYTTVDDVNKRIITVEGFVHAPRDNKRNNLRQLKAILSTLQVNKK